LFFQGMPSLRQNRAAENIKLQFRGADPGFQLRPPPCLDILHSTVYVLDLPQQHGDAQIRFLQPQLLLPFQASTNPQQDFERESECHAR